MSDFMGQVRAAWRPSETAKIAAFDKLADRLDAQRNPAEFSVQDVAVALDAAYASDSSRIAAAIAATVWAVEKADRFGNLPYSRFGNLPHKWEWEGPSLAALRADRKEP